MSGCPHVDSAWHYHKPFKLTHTEAPLAQQFFLLWYLRDLCYTGHTISPLSLFPVLTQFLWSSVTFSTVLRVANYFRADQLCLFHSAFVLFPQKSFLIFLCSVPFYLTLLRFTTEPQSHATDELSVYYPHAKVPDSAVMSSGVGTFETWLGFGEKVRVGTTWN